MSVEIPDPKKLRREAQQARARENRRAKRKAEADAIARAERIAGIQKGKLDELVGRAVNEIKYETGKGYTHARVKLDTIERYGRAEYYEAMEPIWEMVADRLKKYNARIERETDIEYEGLMDPSPVPGDTHIWLYLDWSKP